MIHQFDTHDRREGASSARGATRRFPARAPVTPEDRAADGLHRLLLARSRALVARMLRGLDRSRVVVVVEQRLGAGEVEISLRSPNEAITFLAMRSPRSDAALAALLRDLRDDDPMTQASVVVTDEGIGIYELGEVDAPS